MRDRIGIPPRDLLRPDRIGDEEIGREHGRGPDGESLAQKEIDERHRPEQILDAESRCEKKKHEVRKRDEFQKKAFADIRGHLPLEEVEPGEERAEYREEQISASVRVENCQPEQNARLRAFGERIIQMQKCCRVLDSGGDIKAAKKASGLGQPALFRSRFDPHVEKEQSDSDTNRGIRDVESRPVIAADVDVEKIDDIAETKSIDQVADRASENQVEPALQQPVADRRSEGIDRNNEKDGDRARIQQDRNPGGSAVGSDPERRAGVPDVDDLKKPGDHRDRVVKIETGQDPILRPGVRQDDQKRSGQVGDSIHRRSFQVTKAPPAFRR